MRRAGNRGRLAATGAGLALLLLAACDREGPPRTPARLLARVPADAGFVLSADLAAFRDDRLSRELGLVEACEVAVRDALHDLENGVGIDAAEDLDHVLFSGDLTAESPWMLVELWGRFETGDLTAFLREEGLVEGERNGRPAFTWKGEAGEPPLVIVIEGPRRLRFGTPAGLGRSPDEGGESLGRSLGTDSLLGILDSGVDAFGLYLHPEIDPALIAELPMLGGVLGRLVNGFEGVSGTLRLGDGFTLTGRTRSRREADAETIAALLRGSLDFTREQLRALGETDAANAVDSIEVTRDGTELTVAARVAPDLARRLARILSGGEGDGRPTS